MCFIAATGAAYYTATHFSITTQISKLISPELEWHQREQAFEAAFAGNHDSIVVVVEGPTQELTTAAASALTARLSGRSELFHAVEDLAGSEYFRRNGLMFLPLDEVQQLGGGLGQARQLVTVLATDLSLRGVADAMSFGFLGVQRGVLQFDSLLRPMQMGAATLEGVLAGRPTTFSWYELLQGRPSAPQERRRFIQIHPVLDFSALEPGRVATTAIRQAVAELRLAEDYGARVRLTGPVPIADEEFSTVQDGAVINGVVTAALVLLLLWMALGSGKIILAVALNLAVGLSITAALGLAMVGSLNLISVAFAVLFVGLGVDFGIQMAVRYRAERNDVDDIAAALKGAASGIGRPLTLAAAAVAAGFLSFLPTDYRGVSELGQIAGVGMGVAFLSSLTLLPALIRVLNPGGEPERVGYRALAPVDRFLARHRMKVVIGTLGVVLAGMPLLAYLSFDFNPMNLRSPKVESIATFLDLRTDPNLSANAINVIAANTEAAPAVAERLAKMPEVARVSTLLDLVPQDQEQKLAIIRGLGEELTPGLNQEAEPPPSDAENVEALRSLAELVTETAESAKATGPAADAAKRLVAALTALADAEQPVRDRAEAVLVPPLRTVLADLRDFLRAEPVSLETLPEGLMQRWVAADGRTRIEAAPAGDPNDNEIIRNFARAVLAVYPHAVGVPVSILEAGDTIVRAFLQAGTYALLAITLLLWLTLRRVRDVLLTLLPLMVACAVTLQLCVLLGIPLNFANIIALPLLLGLGCAFKIYYVMAWRAGQANLLQSSLTRAVIWSALTTAVAFGSLWLSSHPGTSSMGQLLALALVTTLVSATLFQPALMGPPRSDMPKNDAPPASGSPTEGRPQQP